MSAIRSLSGVERTSCGRFNLVEHDPLRSVSANAADAMPLRGAFVDYGCRGVLDRTLSALIGAVLSFQSYAAAIRMGRCSCS
jgi:hypothetical protein